MAGGDTGEHISHVPDSTRLNFQKLVKNAVPEQNHGVIYLLPSSL